MYFGELMLHGGHMVLKEPEVMTLSKWLDVFSNVGNVYTQRQKLISRTSMKEEYFS